MDGGARMTAQVFALPDLGEGLTDAELIRWLVAPGDEVTVDQPIAEVETAKAAVELPCPYAGVVTELHGTPGDTIEVGAPVITVTPSATAPEEPEEPAEPAAPAGPAQDGPSAVPRTAPGTADRVPAQSGPVLREPGVESGNVLVGFGPRDQVRRSRAERRRRLAHGAVSARGASAGAAGTRDTPAPADTGHAYAPADAREAKAQATGRRDAPPDASGRTTAVVSPLVRRLARERGVDVHAVRGSGPDGLVLRRDVEAAITAPAEDDATRIPLRGARGRMADRMARSRREIPEATVWVDADATALLAVREEINTADPDHPVTLLGLLARFCVLGLARYPELNARVDAEAREVVLQPAVHLGFAAQTERGLVVPVAHDAQTRTARQLSADLTALTRRARAGDLTPADLTGGTFTVNNYGVFGVDGSAAIINHPETAIVGLGRIIDRPWAVHGTLEVRKITELTLAFDHRACDGGTAGGFLRYVADCVERPTALLGDL